MLAGAALWVLCVSFEVLNVIINVQTPPLTSPLQCCSQSHYSIKKASAVLGFGTENLILLKTDER